MDKQVTIEEAVGTIAAGVSMRLWRKYANVIIGDHQDIKQELWIWAQKKHNKIVDWLDSEQTEEDFQRGLHALEKSMYRAGDRYCRTEKAKRAGYAVRDEVFYNTGMLEILLPEAWSDLHDVGVHMEEGPKPPSNPSEGGNRVVTMFDVQTAVARLEPDDRRLVEWRFRDGLEPHEIAELLGCSKATVYRRLRSVLRKMVDILGGASPW